MKTFFLSLSLLLFATACIDLGLQPDFCRDGDCDYRYYDEAQVSVITMDDGGEAIPQRVTFMVPMDADSFTLSSAAELAAAQAYFSRVCFCGGPLAYPVSGTLQGIRESNTTFEITGDLTFEVPYEDTPRTLSFTRLFHLTEMP